MKALLIIFLVITSLMLIKVLNGESCGRETYASYDGSALEAGITLDAADEKILQETPFLEEVGFDHAELCFYANATDSLEITLIDEFEQELARGFLMSGAYDYCLSFNNRKNESYNFIGIRCDSCDATGDEVTFYRQLLGNPTIETITLLDRDTLTVSLDKPYNWKVNVYPKCWNTIKYFSIWFLTGAIFLLIILGLIQGLKKTEEVIKRE